MEGSVNPRLKMGHSAEIMPFARQVELETERQKAGARLLELGFEMDGDKIIKIPELVYVIRGELTEKLRDIKVDFEDEKFDCPVIKFKRGHRNKEETLPVTSNWFRKSE